MQLINNQSDVLIINRIKGAFTLLTDKIEFNGQYCMKCQFKKNFETFTRTIRGLLFVK